MIDFDALKAHVFAPVVQSYSERDARLYALGLNIGADPLDPSALPHLVSEPPVPVVTMPMALSRLGPWMRDPAVGIDYRKIVVGEMSLRLFAPLPAAATVVGTHKVLRITDKGEGRGALVTVQRQLTDQSSNQLLAEYEQVTFCRADGGFAKDGRHDPAPAAVDWQTDGRIPDLTLDLPTAANQALIYRLSGDYNPLHADPATAQAAGFQRPILHGLATLGMAGHALDNAFRQAGTGGLAAISARLTAPVYPGNRLTLKAWYDADRVLFSVQGPSGQDVVSRGSAESHKFQ